MPGNWALVIGCDSYWTRDADLHGAVRDALKVYRWITSGVGGKVPAANVRLLLGPSPDGQPPPSDLLFTEATNGAIQRALHDLVSLSAGSGDRLFVYFSGHGLSGTVNGIDEPAIVPGDFDLKLTDRAISIRSICEFFATTQIREQYFFFDACRNVPLAEYFNIGQVARPGRSDYSLRSPEQFVCFATSRGLVAAELEEAGNERGVFTQALLEGLAGAGDAKRWDVDRERYTVRWNHLFEHVLKEVRDTKTSVGPGPKSDLIQEPIQTGEHGTNPVLAEFADDAFGPQLLTVSIDPTVAAAAATVTILRPDQATDDSFGPPAQNPHGVPLPPRSYTVRGRATGFRPRRRSWPIDLYVPRHVVLEFDVGDGPESEGFVPRALGDGPRLTVGSDDPLAIVHIDDDTGSVVARGVGSAEVRQSGWFRARALTPDGVTATELVEVEADEQQEVQLPAEGPASDEARASVSDLVASVTGLGRRARTVAISSPQPVTLGVLAVGFRLGDWDAGNGTAQLPSVGRERAHLLIVDERASESRTAPLIEIRSALGPTEHPDLRFAATGPLGVAAFDGGPGAYQVSFTDLLTTPLTVPLHVFANNPSLLVVRIAANGRALVLQFASTFFRGATQRGLVELRRFESAQRFVASGKPALAHELMAGAVPAFDPLADCLAAYLRLRFGSHVEQAGTITELAADTGLPDAILLDAYLSGQNDPRVIESAASQALNVGLPIFDLGMVAAVDTVNASNLRHPIADLVARRLPDQVITTISGETVPQLTDVRSPALVGV